MQNNCGAGLGLVDGGMEEFDKLPKALRAALRDADHNWSGEQLYREFKRRNPKVRTVARAINFIRDNDARVHLATTVGVMPGQRQRVSL